MRLSNRLEPYRQVILDLDGCVWVGSDPTPGAPAAVPAELKAEQPEVVAARAEAEAARAEVDLLRRERIPDPTVSLGYERETRPEEHATGTDLHTGSMLMARLSVPLPFLGGRTRASPSLARRSNFRSWN